MTPSQEEKLIRRLRQRDEQAFRVLVTEYQQKVYNIVYRMVGDRHEAEDVAQEVFITVFKNIDHFREESKFSTWLYRIAINHSKNRLKYLGRRARGKTQTLDDMYEGDLESSSSAQTHDEPDKVLMGQELEVALHKAMDALHEEHRALIILRDIEHLAYEEIARITGLNPGTVKSRLHRARFALHEHLRLRYDT
jgi:RNA polymerase sigma-70 factor (ECF subfamily)